MQPRIPTLAVVLAASLLLAFGAWLVVRSRGLSGPVEDGRSQDSIQPASESNRLERELNQLDRRVGALARDLLRLELQATNRQADVGVPQAAADPAMSGTAMSDAPTTPAGAAPATTQVEQIAQAEREAWAALPPMDAVAYRATEYDEAFEDEAWDRSWSVQEENRMRDSLTGSGMGAPVVLAAECRTSMCRARLAFATTGAREAFWTKSAVTDPWADAGEGFMHCDGWDDVEVEVYYSRSGQPLPHVEPPTRDSTAGRK